MGDFLPWTPMNRCAKFDTASFILGREIRNHTNKQKQKTVTDISTIHSTSPVDFLERCVSVAVLFLSGM